MKLERGCIRRIDGAWGSGILQLKIETVRIRADSDNRFRFEAVGDIRNIPADNGPTIRTLEALFGDVITPGHTFNPDSVIGREVFYMLDDMGVCLQAIMDVDDWDLYEMWLAGCGLPMEEDITNQGVLHGDRIANVLLHNTTWSSPEAFEQAYIDNTGVASVPLAMRDYLDSLEALRLPYTVIDVEGDVCQPMIPYYLAWDAFREGVDAARSDIVAKVFDLDREHGYWIKVQPEDTGDNKC